MYPPVISGVSRGNNLPDIEGIPIWQEVAVSSRYRHWTFQQRQSGAHLFPRDGLTFGLKWWNQPKAFYILSYLTSHVWSCCIIIPSIRTYFHFTKYLMWGYVPFITFYDQCIISLYHVFPRFFHFQFMLLPDWYHQWIGLREQGSRENDPFTQF